MTKTSTFIPIVLQQRKMKRISSHSSLSTVQDSELLPSQKNKKISQSVKKQFIQMVTKNNYSMKNAAKATGISYSTAKKIFTSFRQILQNKSNPIFSSQTSLNHFKRADYSQIISVQTKKLQIFSLIGGGYQEQNKCDQDME